MKHLSLNSYLKKERKLLDFTNKRIAILEGTEGNIVVKKSTFFDQLKKAQKQNKKLYFQVLQLTDEEKVKSNVDVVFLFPAKLFTKRDRAKMIDKIRNLNQS